MRAHCKQSKPNQSRGWAAPSPSTILTTLRIIQTIHLITFSLESICASSLTPQKTDGTEAASETTRKDTDEEEYSYFAFLLKKDLSLGVMDPQCSWKAHLVLKSHASLELFAMFSSYVSAILFSGAVDHCWVNSWTYRQCAHTTQCQQAKEWCWAFFHGILYMLFPYVNRHWAHWSAINLNSVSTIGVNATLKLF